MKIRTRSGTKVVAAAATALVLAAAVAIGASVGVKPSAAAIPMTPESRYIAVQIDASLDTGARSFRLFGVERTDIGLSQGVNTDSGCFSKISWSWAGEALVGWARPYTTTDYHISDFRQSTFGVVVYPTSDCAGPGLWFSLKPYDPTNPGQPDQFVIGNKYVYAQLNASNGQPTP